MKRDVQAECRVVLLQYAHYSDSYEMLFRDELWKFQPDSSNEKHYFLQW